AGQRDAHRLLLELFCVLDHLVGLLLRALIAQVTGAKPLQVQHGGEDLKKGIPHGASLQEYLDKYGFSIPIEKGVDREFNDAIQKPGSFYKYERGGSVTVIDIARGKIYFAYAG
ncbi:hypothetical protein, partial [uncultured Novosphingobium sp.]|uniref:hypothetical protein n=1 Tax=uncultured Novosphingobium sp. TaxID=292277 RepID=UPI0037496730